MAGEQAQENGGPQLSEGRRCPGRLQGPRGGVDPLVGGKCGWHRQVPARQPRGTRSLVDQFDPGVLGGSLGPAPGGIGISGQHRTLQTGLQPAGGQRGRVLDHQLLHRRGEILIKQSGLIGDGISLGPVDSSASERRHGGGHPGQAVGEIHQPAGRAASQRQQNGYLIVDMLNHLPVAAGGSPAG
jgi:hypothetical protein